MSVNADAVRQGLEGQKAKGRSSVEAAGITLWLADQEEAQRLFGRKVTNERAQIVRDWLAGEIGTPEEIELYAAAAEECARFFAEQVDLSVPEHPDVVIDRTLAEWRKIGRP